ncbi:OmpA family protein [Algoriphagus sp.]|uniref:OmpA family protein n=1 Tax=Algoriphagus sp. TaxID=1872435 RepID=UPI00391CE830
MMRFFQIICWVILLTLSIPVIGQRSDFDWRIGISGGYSNYYGDLSPYTIRGLSNGKAFGQLFEYNPNYVEKPSFKITVERALSPTIGLSLAYGQYTFGASDRFIRKDGTIWNDAPNFSRGLNFQNQSRSYGLGLVFKANNGRLLPANSWISPYFNLGVGFLDFQVRGDLLNRRGQRYDYSSLRAIHDGIYETNLAEVQTEGPYPLHAFYSNFGLGFSIRLTKRFELFAESEIMFTFSDHLDDVSGKYRGDYTNDFQEYAANPNSIPVIPGQTWRGNPNGLNDWVIYHSVGLKYNLGVSKRTFKAPRISTFLPSYSSTKKKGSIESAEQDQSTSDSVLIRRMSQLELSQKNDKLRVDSLSQKLLLVDLEQAISKRENYLRAIENRRKTLLEIQQSSRLWLDSLIQNESRTEDFADSIRAAAIKGQFDLRYSLDSINRREFEIKNEIDSISRLKKYFFAPENKMEEKFNRGLVDEDTISEKGELFYSDSVIIENKMLSNNAALQTDSVSSMNQRGSSEEPNALIDIEEILRVKAENQNLRLLLDQALLDKEESKTGKPIQSEQRQTIIRETVQVQSSESKKTDLPDKRNERSNNQARDRLLLTGGAFAAGTAVGNQSAGNSSSEASKDSLLLLPTHTDSTYLDSNFVTDKSYDLNFQRLNLSPQLQSFKMTDTVYLTKEGVVRLLPGKASLYFAINQKVPSEAEIQKLEELVEFFESQENLYFVLSGFADNTGSLTYNLKLADERMASIAKILQSKYDIPEVRIQLESGGQVIRGTKKTSAEKDRRVEVRVQSASEDFQEKLDDPF